MKKSLLSATAAAMIAGIAAPAMAADMPVKAYRAPLPPVYSWTGCYAGIEGGWIGDHRTFNRNADNIIVSVGGVVLAQSLTSTSTHRSGGLFGGTLGCNYQFNTWGVVGIEGDISATGGRNSFAESFPAITALSARTETLSDRMNWLATIRGRLGYLVSPNWLLYVTGGGAFANDNASFALVTVLNTQFIGSDSKTLSGGVIGGGAEWAWTSNWRIKAEYLYVGLNHHTFASPLVLLNGGAVPANLAGGTWITNVGSHHDNIFRVGLNYAFGGAPVATRY
jgi:outer membrane immunogenic protein